MTTASALQAELIELTNNMIAQVKDFPAVSFTQVPASGGWSAAELAEHVFIVTRNINSVLQSEGSVPERAPDKKLPVIIAALADRSTKRVAPENVKPTGKLKGRAELADALQQQLQLLVKIAGEKELMELCTVYPHPSLGRLTRLEWIHFIIHHTQRHLLQLEEIKHEVAN